MEKVGGVLWQVMAQDGHYQNEEFALGRFQILVMPH